MPRRAKSIESSRFNIMLSVKARQELEQISSEAGHSMADMVRVALAMLKASHDASKKGNSLAIIDSNRNVLYEITIAK